MAIEIDYTTVTVYVNTLEGFDTESIKVSLDYSIVQYKTEGLIRSTPIYFEPVDGLISIVVPDTDDMDGTQYYIFDFGNGIRYKAQVPKVDEINFWDLELEQSIDKEFPTLR